MDTSGDAKLWDRVDRSLYDVSAGTYLSNFMRQCAVMENFDPDRADAREVALFTASAVVRYRDDPMAWDLVTRRSLDVVFGKLVVPLEQGIRSRDRQLESDIKKVALVTLCQRPDASRLPENWFADLETVAAMAGDPAPSHACDCLIDNIINPHATATEESKLDQATIERAISALRKLDTRPTGDSWCVLAMADQSTRTSAISAVLGKMGVPRPSPSVFLSSVHHRQFTVENSHLIGQAVSRLQALRPPSPSPTIPTPPVRLPFPVPNDKDGETVDDDVELWSLSSHTRGLLGEFVGANWPLRTDEASKLAHSKIYGRFGDNLNARLRDAVPLLHPPRKGTVVWYTTHDKKPRTHGDPEHMHKDMVAVLSGFIARIRSGKLGLADVADLFEARGLDLELVARCGPERCSVAMLVVHALDSAKSSEVDALVRVCVACGTALSRHGWSLAHLDESINAAVWSRLMRLYLHTRDADLVHKLQAVLGLSPRICSATAVMDAIKDHVEPTDACKTRFVSVFRLHEMIMARQQ
jgi:hypothetical protein